MSKMSRRSFLAGASALACPGIVSAQTLYDFDYIISGVPPAVLNDPTQPQFFDTYDIGVKNGKIAGIGKPLDRGRALYGRVLDVSQPNPVPGGIYRIAMPGLIDLHTHIYPQGTGIGVRAADMALANGATSICSAGDVGAPGYVGFKRAVIDQSTPRVYTWLNIANMGLAAFSPFFSSELVNNANAMDVELMAKTLAENPEIIGVKVRMSLDNIGTLGLVPLQKALDAIAQCGRPAKIMCHIGGLGTIALLGQVIDLLRAGDVLTHCYQAVAGPDGQVTSIVSNGTLIPAAVNAKARGVVFDVGHGGASFNFAVAEAAIAQGCPPDTLSSDINFYSHFAGMPQYVTLPYVMGSLAACAGGPNLEQVISKATTAPAAVLGREPTGTLQIGAPADITITDYYDKPTVYTDATGATRTAPFALRPFQVIVRGGTFLRAQ